MSAVVEAPGRDGWQRWPDATDLAIERARDDIARVLGGLSLTQRIEIERSLWRLRDDLPRSAADPWC